MDPTRTLPAELAEAARAYADGSRVPAEPRDAATVVLVRQGAVRRGGLEAYLLRRHVGMAFAAGMSVFPGGGVDPRDLGLPRASWSGPTPTDWAARLGCAADLATALVGAAVRETFEESGVLLAGPADGDVVSDTTGLEAERRALAGHELSLADLLAERAWVLRSDLLAALGGWVTPVFEPRRYRTWFFVAALPPGQRTRDVSTESDEAAWWSLRDAVAAVDEGRMAMLPPTYATCCELYAATSPGEALSLAAGRPWSMVEPTVEDGRLVVPRRVVELGLAVGAEAVRA